MISEGQRGCDEITAGTIVQFSIEPVRKMGNGDSTSSYMNEKPGFSFESGDVGSPNSNSRTGSEHNNNPIERYNEDIEQRYKVIRGFKGFTNASAFLEMKRIVHNFVNPHMQLDGITPAEKAEIRLPLGQNKLLSLINYTYLTKR